MGFPAVLFGIFYLIGFGLLGYGAWGAWRSTRAGTWPATLGSVTEVSLEQNHSSDAESGPTYEVKVRYSYTVNGVAYEGSRIAFGYGADGSQEAHAEVYRKLRDAKQVSVRYDPADPSVSSLSYGVHRGIRIILAFAITWLAFAVGFSLLWWLTSRSDSVLLDNLSVQ
jgi:hypothetical protein